MSISRAKDVLGALDVRLMRVLLVLLDENSVSRAAAILGQTQPTVSAALKRLREMAGDPLLVRSGSHLVPTERALELRRLVARALDDIDAGFAGPAVFDPQTTERKFQIVAANSLGPLFLPRFVDRLRRAAPHATVDVCGPPANGEFVPCFERGELDFAIVNEPLKPDELRIAPLLTTDFVCLVGKQHRIAQAARVDLETYLLLDHVTPTRGVMGPVGPVDSKLQAMGRARRIMFWAPEFGVIPYVLLQSELVFTTGRHFAEHLASLLPLAALPAPVEFGEMKFHMLWHERQHRSPAHRWLRDLARGVTAEIGRRTPGLQKQPA
jgi:DNA-binding transcriptional LysR family regulator